MKRGTGVWCAIVVLMVVEEYGKKKEENGRKKIEKFIKHEFKITLFEI